MENLYFDTMLAAYLINPEKKSLALKNLSKEILGVKLFEYEEVFGGEKDLLSEKLSPQKYSEYSCRDADSTFRLFKN